MTESPSTPLSVLFVDDDRDVASAAQLVFERRDIRFAWAATPEAAWAGLAATPDVVVLDLNFTRSETSGAVGLELLAKLLLHDPGLPIVVVTGHSGVAIAVSAMRAGAVDFLIKPWRNERLAEAITRAGELGRSRRTGRSQSESAKLDSQVPLLGTSAAMAHINALIAKAAPTAASVLIHGGIGTGKSLVAGAMHRASARPGGLLILEARETPSADVTSAAVAAAGAGTLLIEDLDLLGAPAQSRLGAALHPGLRVIATTRLTPEVLHASGTVRDDLLSRLSTIEIALPPLAERRGDIRLLADYYLQVYAARHSRLSRPLDDHAAAAIAADPWPGGIRALAAACERAVVLGDGDRHTLDHFALSAMPAPGVVRTIAANFNLSQSERSLVEAALRRHAHNVSRAATDLGITRATLYRRMAKHGL